LRARRECLMEPASEVRCILFAVPTVCLLHASLCILAVIDHLPAPQPTGGASYDKCTMSSV
jgi:hypothetical protein